MVIFGLVVWLELELGVIVLEGDEYVVVFWIEFESGGGVGNLFFEVEFMFLIEEINGFDVVELFLEWVGCVVFLFELFVKCEDGGWVFEFILWWFGVIIGLLDGGVNNLENFSFELFWFKVGFFWEFGVIVVFDVLVLGIWCGFVFFVILWFLFDWVLLLMLVVEGGFCILFRWWSVSIKLLLVWICLMLY